MLEALFRLDNKIIVIPSATGLLGRKHSEALITLMHLNDRNKVKENAGLFVLILLFMGAQMMTGNNSAKEWVGYQDPNFHQLNIFHPW